ncbi:patatin-like phospholipase family protein [Pseudaquabacterium pictum]|uniref:Exported phospholipase n=1 Tax=Pseudaquabacterium pictum TaxID=2315236 RepID=A0A480AP07_9BURK|nr:patatin-like phospholipase family protein [Rubrivivax pictus]GCL63304.1 exported phospholipase [Rubrivivax pictus]
MSGPTRRGWLGAASALGAATLLPGCALQPDQDHTGPDAPEAGPLARTPRVAWIFSSGGPRGFVHVGVVKALHQLGLRPDLIVGASAGALVGTLCAAGVPAEAIERAALGLQPWELVRWAPGSQQRLAATGLASWVQQAVGGRPLQALPTPVLCAVQRLRDGAVLGFNRGHAGLAVQASAAIEGQFTPVTIRGEAFADADLRMPLPVRLARAAGATRVLAVDASAHEDRAPAGAQRYRESDLRKRALTAPDAALADVLLHPEFGYWVSMTEAFRRRAIDAGHAATLAAAPALRALHAG